MKLRTLMVLLLAGIWGVAGWWWYTCKIKDFCSADTSGAPVASAAENTDTASKTEATTVTSADANSAQAATPVTASSNDTSDSDNDGLPDVLERKLGLDPYVSDSDKDGLRDDIEIGNNTDAPLDSDDDGIINALDNDDDGDGDLTINESPDPNGDGTSDDARDSNADGLPDYLDKATGWAMMDDDGDGISNGDEKLIGTNPALTDSDGDGVADGIELVDNQDTDKDGTIDALDTDDDGDGIMTAMENPDPNGDGSIADAADNDRDGIPDYLDADSSGEVILPKESEQKPVDTDQDMALAAADPAKTGDEVTNDSVSQTDQSTETTPEATDKPAAETGAATETATETESSADKTAETTAPAEPEPESKPAAEPANAKKDAKKDDKNGKDDKNKLTVDTEGGDAQEEADTAKNADETGKKVKVPKRIRAAKLYFPFRSAEPELADSAAGYIDGVIAYLNAHPETKIKLIGHTDSVGRQAYNRKLGLKRAGEIRDMLVKRGAAKAQIEVDSLGEEEPIADNATDDGREKNRRVELVPLK